MGEDSKGNYQSKRIVVEQCYHREVLAQGSEMTQNHGEFPINLKINK